MTTQPCIGGKDVCEAASLSCAETPLLDTDSAAVNNTYSGSQETQASCSDAIQPNNHSNRGHARERDSSSGAQDKQEGLDMQAEKRIQLPEPFVQRPRIGSRLFVQSHFPGIAAALAAEMISWQTDMRIRSAFAWNPSNSDTGVVTLSSTAERESILLVLHVCKLYDKQAAFNSRLHICILRSEQGWISHTCATVTKAPAVTFCFCWVGVLSMRPCSEPAPSEQGGVEC